MKESCVNLMCFVYVIPLYKMSEVYILRPENKDYVLSQKRERQKKSISFIYMFSLIHICADALIHYCVILGLLGINPDQVFIVSLKTYIRYVLATISKYPHLLKINSVHFRDKSFLQRYIILQILQ